MKPKGTTAMERTRRIMLMTLAVLTLAFNAPAADPLPSWNDGAVKQSIVEFVQAVTTEGGVKFVPPAERIAVFDNDGTLWAEHPMYFQLLFALDRVKALAPQHPEWKEKQPFKAVLEGDMKTVVAGGEHALLELVMATHAGMTTTEFAAVVQDWLATAKHPRFHQPYTELGLSADARTAGVSARERLQDLYRFWGRYRVHAPVDGEGVRYPARTGHW
jgi:hypothetical protein